EDGPHPYAAVWKAFGPLLKEGYYHDPEYRELLLPLLRFNAVSHADGDTRFSLADYKAAMPEGQDTIWYLAGPSRETSLRSPHLEAFSERGWDVLLLNDPVDEWFISVLSEFDGVVVKSVARGELELSEGDDAEPAEKV